MLGRARVLHGAVRLDPWRVRVYEFRGASDHPVRVSEPPDCGIYPCCGQWAIVRHDHVLQLPMNRIGRFPLALLLLGASTLAGCTDADQNDVVQIRSGAEWMYEGPSGLNLTIRLLEEQAVLGINHTTWAIEYELLIKREVKATITEFLDTASGTTLGWKNDCNIIVQRPDRVVPSCFRDRLRWAFVGEGLPAFMGAASWLQARDEGGATVASESGVCMTINQTNRPENARSMFWSFAEGLMICSGKFAPQSFRAPVPAFLSRTQGLVEFRQVDAREGFGVPFPGFGRQAPPNTVGSARGRLEPLDGARAEIPVAVERANRDASNLSNHYREVLDAGGRLYEYQYYPAGSFSTVFGFLDGDSSRVIIAARNEDQGHQVVLEYQRTGPEELRRARLVEESSKPGGVTPGSVHTLDQALDRFHALGLPPDEEYKQAAWRPSGSDSLDIFIIGTPRPDVELAWGVRHENARVEEGAVAFFPLEGIEQGDGRLLVLDQPL